MIDKDLQNSLRQNYNPEGSDLRKAQYTMLELLIFLDKICKEHNLTYWLDSGTLLGAVRHGGFIPWDDDVDVCMPRKDAKKLKKIMGNKVYENHIVLQNQSTDWNYLNCGWMTLRDLKSEYIQDSNIHKRLKYRGLQVDIFEMETGLTHWMIRLSNIIHRHLIMKLATRTNSKLVRNMINCNARILNNLMIPFFRLFKKNDNIINYALGIPFSNKFHKNIIFPLKQISFENGVFPCPNQTNEYLKTLYGRWELIPEEENIQTHNVKFKFTD